MQNRVVAHLNDGRLIKGMSLDVAPSRPKCHVRTESDGVVPVTLADLKALFFVHDLNGNPDYVESDQPVDGDVRLHGTRQIELKFADGERMVGLTNRVPPPRPFFFVMPIDNRSNNIRLLVNSGALATMNAL